jgi:hypothetical protein
MLMTRAGYEAGIWALFAGFDRSVLQFKPGLLMSDAEAGETLARLGAATEGLLASGALEDPAVTAELLGVASSRVIAVERATGAGADT